MLFTAVMVIVVSVSRAFAGTSRVKTLPSTAVREMLPPAGEILLLAVWVLSSCTVTLSGLATFVKSIAGPFPSSFEVFGERNLHDKAIARSRKTDKTGVMFFIMAIGCFKFSKQSEFQAVFHQWLLSNECAQVTFC